MILADLAPGSAVFVDANIFINHFTAHPQFGAPCIDVLERPHSQQSRSPDNDH